MFIRTSWFVIPQQLPQADVWSALLSGEWGESTGGLRGGTLESSFYKGWGKGYVQAAAAVGVREGLSGRPLSPWQCCEFCKSLPTGWGSKMTHPRCSTARHLPTPGNAPPCLRSCKIRVRGEGVDGGQLLYAPAWVRRDESAVLHSSVCFLCGGSHTDAWCKPLVVWEMGHECNTLHRCVSKIITGHMAKKSHVNKHSSIRSELFWKANSRWVMKQSVSSWYSCHWRHIFFF